MIEQCLIINELKAIFLQLIYVIWVIATKKNQRSVKQSENPHNTEGLVFAKRKVLLLLRFLKLKVSD